MHISRMADVCSPGQIMGFVLSFISDYSGKHPETFHLALMVKGDFGGYILLIYFFILDFEVIPSCAQDLF